MCILDIASPLNGGPLPVTPTFPKGQGGVEKKNLFVPGCWLFSSSYSPRDLPCSE